MLYKRKDAPGAPAGPAEGGRERTRGQAMVEFTLMLPLILVLGVGILEFGMLFKDHMGIHYASREGARLGAAASQDPLADCFILDAVSTTMKTMDINKLVLVRVYRADPAPGPNNGNCLIDTSTGNCPEDLYIPYAGTPTACTTWGTSEGSGWALLPPRSGGEYWPPQPNVNTGYPGRINQVAGPDSLAVEIRYNHQFFFDYVPGANGLIEIFDRTYNQIEPERMRPVPTRTPH